eukprot:scaffold75408_cov31-Tisochrysis_lutea.AAC.2
MYSRPTKIRGNKRLDVRLRNALRGPSHRRVEMVGKSAPSLGDSLAGATAAALSARSCGGNRRSDTSSPGRLESAFSLRMARSTSSSVASMPGGS